MPASPAYPTFYPPKNPQSPLSITIQPRLLTPQFGHGYPEYAPDGLNISLRQVQLTFDVLTEDEFLAIDAFITQNLTQRVLYMLPDETAPRLWMISSRAPRVQETVWGYDITLLEKPFF